METFNLDATPEAADWTKQSWDLPPYKSDEFYQFVPRDTLDAFRQRPVYTHAVARGLIQGDEWVGQAGVVAKRFSVTSHVFKFDEDKHPRGDEHGRWTDSGETAITPTGASKDAVKLGAKRWAWGDGRPMSAEDHARVIAAKVPPGWSDIHLNPDAKAALQVRGKDAAGRWQRRYSAEHSTQAAAEKFARLKDFNAVLPTIRESMARDIDAHDTPPGLRDTATALAIIDKTGLRVGGEESTGAKQQAYGISTLEGQHVKIEGDHVRLEFTGKEGITNTAEFTDARIAEALRERDPQPGVRLFNTNDTKIGAYVDKVGGDQFKTKDFRTWVATATALDAMKGKTQPSDPKAFKAFQRDIATYVAKKLCNTPAEALRSYIDPAVWERWGKA